MRRYGVVLIYREQRTRDTASCRFHRLNRAVKERDRLNDAAWFRVETHADLLGKGSFKYRWRVWDYANRRFAD